jgi:hypothetical protein
MHIYVYMYIYTLSISLNMTDFQNILLIGNIYVNYTH